MDTFRVSAEFSAQPVVAKASSNNAHLKNIILFGVMLQVIDENWPSVSAIKTMQVTWYNITQSVQLFTIFQETFTENHPFASHRYNSFSVGF